MQRFFVFLVLFFGFSSALVVGPYLYEQKDFGDPGLATFTYSLSADCNASTITAIIMDNNTKPVRDAGTYLKYLDFASPLLTSVTSDKDGYTLHKLPGQVSLMRGLFILVIEKRGYRNKELHFDLSPCFYNGNPPPKPPKPQQKPKTNSTAPPTNITSSAQNSTLNTTIDFNKTNETKLNETGSPPIAKNQSLCPGVLLIFLMVYTQFLKS